METDSERLDAERLRGLSTPDLLRHVLEEARLLARAEILVVREELQRELSRAKVAGILAGAALVLTLSGIALLLVAVAAALPLTLWLAALIVGVALLLISGLLAFLAYRKAPTRPLERSQLRLKQDLALTRETLQ
ncbi:MAG TPA: phage holin family protein [Myxococcaceae bacterium]|nr:phage holin family protein [Myxococcaceae bacterium]